MFDNILTDATQEYKYADVLIIWVDNCSFDLEKVTFSLSEDNEPSDKNIFMHCNGYDDFRAFIAEADNTCDFHVVSILRLY